MQELALDSGDCARDALNAIRDSISSREKIIPINGNFYFTKGLPGKVSGYVLRDEVLEENVKRWLRSRVPFERIMDRYKDCYPMISSLDWPAHYATRFVNIEGRLAENNNIFMFFPEVLGLSTEAVEDYFGFEFIDVWVSVFEEIIFPCMRRVFDEETQLELFSVLRPVLEYTIYLSSVFHEIGHRCGYWRVSPAIDGRININKFHTDVLGELATDTLSVILLSEFPETLYFVFLQRLFWFGRFGFRESPENGKLNEDNDCWIGAYLWNKYVSVGALKQNSDGRWHINFNKLLDVFRHVFNEIEQLGQDAISKKGSQDRIINDWMREGVQLANNHFMLPREMQSIFIKCIDIVDKPVFKY